MIGNTSEIIGGKSIQTATGKQAMVVTAFPAATEAGLEILKAGGNAVDAAVAAAWALSVCEPSGSGLGGQTTLLILAPDGKITALDGHSYAPAGVSDRTVNEMQQQWGYRACTVPATVATLGAATQKFGRLPAARVMEPAIRLAVEGFPVTKLLRKHINWCQATLSANPHAERIFLPKGKPLAEEALLVQPELAKVLQRLATHGTDDFYDGEIARAIADDMHQNGGLLAFEDLATCQLPVERDLLTLSYRGHQIVTVPPPGGGVQLLICLKVLEHLLDPEAGANDPAWYEAMALVVNVAFRERERWPLAPEFMTPSFRRWLLSDERAAELAAAVRSEYNLDPIDEEEEPGETTHLCTVDSEGMAVALTQSVQSLFGAKVAGKKLGFFYNNYLTTCPRYPHPYQLKSRAMPQSNVVPTFIFKEGEPASAKSLRMMIGAAGSRRITSSVLQVVTNYLVRNMPLPEAMAAPRVHTLLSGKVLVERNLASESLSGRLSRYFNRIQVKATWSNAMGTVQAVARDEAGQWIGVADPRREGSAGGY